MQTKIRREQISGGNDGWIPVQGTWSYASATTITVPSGAASLYQKGDKIKLTQTTVKYFYIVGVADTLLTVTGGTDYTVANAAITLPFYSHIENPVGFPHWFNYTLTLTAAGGTAPTYAVAYTRFRISNLDVHCTIYLLNTSGGTAGAGAVLLTLTLPVAADSMLSILGFGTIYEDAGTIVTGFARFNSATSIYMHNSAYANITAADQSSAARQIHFNLQYPLA